MDGLPLVVGNGDGVPRYLTGIISSQLTWIDNEEMKERIWETVSTRLSERSGRTGMSQFVCSSEDLLSALEECAGNHIS